MCDSKVVRVCVLCTVNVYKANSLIERSVYCVH